MNDVQPEMPMLSAPADGIPLLIETASALEVAITQIDGSSGPIAVDTERAQGFRYGGEAWLIQLRPLGGPTMLIDPSAFAWQLSALNEVLSPREWILHAASQDLPCLADCELTPTAVFDTELAARLLHDPRVGLGSLVESELGVRLAKEHSAADWSQRPLPEDMRNYAALDVELLHQLRDTIEARLRASDKWTWAQEEFAALVAHDWSSPETREEPWRRTKGLSTLTLPAQYALVRALWEARDEIAQDLDKGPARVLPDQAIIDAARLVDRGKPWPTWRNVKQIEGFRRRLAARYTDRWTEVVEKTGELAAADHPVTRVATSGPSRQPRNWQRHHPERFARFQALRPVLMSLANTHDVPVENLLSPSALRRLAWEPPTDVTVESVAELLREEGARNWQVALCAPVLAKALTTAS